MQEVPSLPGIYYFFIPPIKKGYVGSSKDLKARIKAHYHRSHVKDLNTYKSSLQLKILEVMPEASLVEVRKREQFFIDKYKSLGIKLLNKATPNISERQDKYSVYQYDLKGNFITKYASLTVAMKELRISEKLARELVNGVVKARQSYHLIYFKDCGLLKERMLELKRLKRFLKKAK